MYRSVLSQRTAPVDGYDFQALEGILTFNGAREPLDLTDEDIRLWNNFLPYTPLQVYEMLAEGYGDATPEMKVTIEYSGILKYKLAMPENPDFRVSGEFGIGPADGMGRSEVHVPENMRQHGMGRNWLRSQIEFSAALDYDHYAFSAGQTHGGYVWARAGATLDRSLERYPDIHEQLTNLSQVLLLKLEAFRPFLPKQDYSLARAFCRVTDAHDLNKLAEMKHATIPADALPEITGRIDQLLAANIFSRADVQTGIVARSSLFDTFEMATKAGSDSVPLSQALLMSTFWPAVVNFNDRMTMDKVESYVGGWQTIERADAPVMAL